METKTLFQSRTFWVAALTFFVGVITLIPEVFGAYLPSEIAGGLLAILGILNMVLRAMTSAPIEGIK